TAVGFGTEHPEPGGGTDQREDDRHQPAASPIRRQSHTNYLGWGECLRGGWDLADPDDSVRRIRAHTLPGLGCGVGAIVNAGSVTRYVGTVGGAEDRIRRHGCHRKVGP